MFLFFSFKKKEKSWVLIWVMLDANYIIKKYIIDKGLWYHQGVAQKSVSFVNGKIFSRGTILTRLDPFTTSI